MGSGLSAFAIWADEGGVDAGLGGDVGEAGTAFEPQLVAVRTNNPNSAMRKR
jgi:hypothetical protein